MVPNRRTAVLLGIFGVLVVVWLVAVVGSDDGPGGAPSDPTGDAGPGTEPAAPGPDDPFDPSDPGPTPDDPEVPADELPVYATKNPFEPVISPAPPAPPDPTDPGAPADPTDPGAPADPTGPTDPVAPPDPTGPTDPGAPTGPGDPVDPDPPTFEPPAREAVALLDVDEDADGTRRAQVRVGSTVYTVSEGDVFATSYQVVALEARCGSFRFGDVPFSLCVGEQVLK